MFNYESANFPWGRDTFFTIRSPRHVVCASCTQPWPPGHGNMCPACRCLYHDRLLCTHQRPSPPKTDWAYKNTCAGCSVWD